MAPAAAVEAHTADFKDNEKQQQKDVAEQDTSGTQTGAPAAEATEGTGEGTARRRRGRRGGRRRRRGGGEAGSSEENGPDTSLLDDDGDTEGGNTPVATRSQPEFDFDDQAAPDAQAATGAEEKPAKPPRQPRKRAAAKPQAGETQDEASPDQPAQAPSADAPETTPAVAAAAAIPVAAAAVDSDAPSPAASPVIAADTGTPSTEAGPSSVDSEKVEEEVVPQPEPVADATVVEESVVPAPVPVEPEAEKPRQPEAGSAVGTPPAGTTPAAGSSSGHVQDGNGIAKHTAGLFDTQQQEPEAPAAEAAVEGDAGTRASTQDTPGGDGDHDRRA